MNSLLPQPTRRDMLVGASAAIVMSSSASAAASGQTAVSDRSSAADGVARQMQADNPEFALSLAVATSDRLVWAGAYGKSDLEFDVPATTEHTFRLGSVSKVLTSTLAAKLASRKVLDLDAPIATWMPDLPSAHQSTTLRQLLTHRGGVRHYLPKDADVGAPGGPIFQRYYPTNREVLAVFVDDPLIAPPGTKVSYSSFGYTLASLVMEAAAKKDFRQLIAAEIAGPFSLPSLTDDDPLAIRPMRARGYVRSFDLNAMLPAIAPTIHLDGNLGNMPQSNPAYCWAGAGFLMSPTDTALFGAAMLAGPGAKITEEERRLLFTPMTAQSGDMPPLGLGWRIDTDAKQRLRWHHEGATPGGRYCLVVYPDAGLAIAMGLNVMIVRLDVLGKSAALADLFS
jgi:serine beta-lactamase-like protein LACTB